MCHEHQLIQIFNLIETSLFDCIRPHWLVDRETQAKNIEPSAQTQMSDKNLKIIKASSVFEQLDFTNLIVFQAQFDFTSLGQF